MSDEYEILIEDLELPSEECEEERKNRLLKQQIQKTVNEALARQPHETRTPKGLEIDVPDSWSEILLKDGSIIRGYEKIGWKVIWYNLHSLGPATGDLIRSWLSFRDRAFVPKQ